MKSLIPRYENGFTVVELMISLTILSTILLMSTMVLINIGSLFSKGINAANLQNANRNVSSDISSTLQFSGNNPSSCVIETGTYCATGVILAATPQQANVYSICIGTTRYSFIMNRALRTDSADPANSPRPHVLWRDRMKTPANCPPLQINDNTILADSNTDTTYGNGYEMYPDRVRLTKFKIKETAPNSGVFSIDTFAAFGDTDLLTAVDPQGNTNCITGFGQQYCGTSRLNVSVSRRAQ